MSGGERAPDTHATGVRLRDTPMLGHPRLHLRRADSTNERARALAVAGAPHGTLVTAAEQTAGRGRQGRRWSAPPDSSLLMSLLLRHPEPDHAAARPRTQVPAPLPLAAAVAVCDVLGAKTRIKWPNDVVFERATADTDSGTALAKVAGILLESRPQEGWAVLGIGVNVALRVDELPAEVRAGAATLGLRSSAIEPLLGRLLRALERRLDEPAAAILEAWRARDALRGRGISWDGGRGRAEGIDAEGRLLVTLPDGARAALGAGEVHLTDVGSSLADLD